MKKVNIDDLTIKELKENGYRVFKSDKYDSWIYVITPNDNLLSVSCGDFWGYNVTLEYIPSPQDGTGCRCNDEPIMEIDMQTLRRAEREGLSFARKLNAKLYSSAEKALKKQYFESAFYEVLA